MGKVKAAIALAERHIAALWLVVTVVVPILIRTRARPVLFEKFAGIGDIICTFPAALELKKRHPKSDCIYNCHRDYACLPRMSGVAQHVTHSRAAGLVGYWYRFLLSGYYQFASDDDNADAIPSDVYIKDFGKPFDVVVDDAHPALRNDPIVLAKVRSLLRECEVDGDRFIVIHPGPSWPVREWPLQSWVAFIAALQRNGWTNVVQLGASKVLRFGSVEVPPIPGVVSLVDKLNLEESTALISCAKLFVGIDSGLLHIAASVGTPAVGVWGPTLPKLRFSGSEARSFVTSGVDCRGCQHRPPRLHWFVNCPRNILCMRSIPVEEVLNASLSRLDSTSA